MGRHRQRKGRRVMASEKLPLHLIGVYQDAFNRTAYADGSVDSTGVKTIMRSVGQNPSDAEVADMINQVDKDGTGSLDFPEFLMMMCLKSDVENAEDEIREAFQVFDGVISIPYIAGWEWIHQQAGAGLCYGEP